jgi:multiple sugar transport system permease protein
MTKWQKQNVLRALGFLAPNLTGFLVFTSLPVVFSFLLAFFRWDMFSTPTFVGFDNFIRLLKDPKLWTYLYNTVFFMMGMPLSIAGSLFLALILSQKIRGLVAYRTIFYLPTVTNGIALYLLWKWLYNPKYGLINSILLPIMTRLPLGIESIDDLPDWLHSSVQIDFLEWFGLDPISYWAKPAIIVMGIWASIGGGNMILYLAALANVPDELYEAADIDGTTRWQRFRHITWPMIGPTTFFIVVMSIIGGLQGGFEVAYLMTLGGPGKDADNTVTLGYYIYRAAFENLEFGYAAAIAWCMFLIIFGITIINWRFGKGMVHS